MSRENIIKIIIGVVVIALIVFLNWLILSGKKQTEELEPGNMDKSTQEQGMELLKPTDGFVSDVISAPAKEGEVAQGFPSFIPLNGKMNIIESYSQQSRTTGEVFEAVVVFQSSKNLKENQTFYEKWANDNSWQISTSKQVNNIQLSLSNTKNKETFTIELEELLQNTTKVTMVYYPAVNGEVDMDKVREQLKIKL